MIEELEEHGYQMSPGTLYPILHGMEASGLLHREERIVAGKVRKYYGITEKGKEILEEAKKKAFELFKEIKDQ
jgi:DNA-binding PadR family transcriptional regulator